MALASVAAGLDRLHLLGSDGFVHAYFPWSLWTGSLLLLTAGFLWVGFAPEFSRFGIVVALFHLLQAIYLLLIVTNLIAVFVPLESLALGRLSSLFFFALLARPRLSTTGLMLLATSAAVQVVKIILRVFEVLPESDAAGLVYFDTALLLVMAAAIYLVGVSFLKHDTDWEETHPREEAMELDEFNNPEHPWNKGRKK